MILFVTYLQTFAVSFTVVKAKEKLYISIEARGFLSCLYTVYIVWTLVPLMLMLLCANIDDEKVMGFFFFFFFFGLVYIYRKLCDPSRVRPDYQKTRGPSF